MTSDSVWQFSYWRRTTLSMRNLLSNATTCPALDDFGAKKYFRTEPLASECGLDLSPDTANVHGNITVHLTRHVTSADWICARHGENTTVSRARGTGALRPIGNFNSQVCSRSSLELRACGALLPSRRSIKFDPHHGNSAQIEKKCELAEVVA